MGLADAVPSANTIWAFREAPMQAAAIDGLVPPQEAPGQADAGSQHIAKAQKSKVRSKVEHVFAHRKRPMRLVVRTIGIARAQVKIGLADISNNMRRAVWLQSKIASALPEGGRPRPLRVNQPASIRSAQEAADLLRSLESIGSWRCPVF